MRSTPSNVNPNNDDQTIGYFVAGKSITDSDALALEAKFRENSENLQIRLRLLGYYSKNFQSPTLLELRMAHTLWMIENCPSNPVCYYLTLDNRYTKSQQCELMERWLEMVRLKPEDDCVVGNLGSAVISLDRVLAENCFLKAQKLNPENPRWTRRLAKMYKHEALQGPIEERAKYAALAVREARSSLKLNDARGEQTAILMEITPIAIQFNHLTEARSWSNELLSFGLDCTYRLWAQTAWLFLAQIELLEGNVKKSIEWLGNAIESIRVEEASQIVYGSNMITLLESLLVSGEQKVVLDALSICFDRCPIEFEKDQEMKKQLLNWSIALSKDKTSRFGATNSN